MKARRWFLALAILAMAPLFAGAAMAQGGTGGGGGGTAGGGGGGGGGAAVCAPTGLNIYESAAGEPVANWWQPNTTYMGSARGTATKACDTIRDLIVRFEDTTVAAGQPCSFEIPQYTSLGYFKYGINPPSRFQSYFIYSTGDSCLGQPHVIRATMSNSKTGVVYGSVDLTFAS